MDSETKLLTEIFKDAYECPDSWIPEYQQLLCPGHLSENQGGFKRNIIELEVH